MNLLMYISNDLIDCIPLERNKISSPGYIGHFIRMLREKHEEILIQSMEEPEFLVHHNNLIPVSNMKFAEHVYG
jgi:SAM-dependent MidA family methyltransferase